MQSYILMVRFSECQNYQNINESDGNVKYSRTYGLKCDDNNYWPWLVQIRRSSKGREWQVHVRLIGDVMRMQQAAWLVATSQ